METVLEVIKMKEKFEAKIVMLTTVATKRKKLTEEDRLIAEEMLKEQQEALNEFLERDCVHYAKLVSSAAEEGVINQEPVSEDGGITLTSEDV